MTFAEQVAADLQSIEADLPGNSITYGAVGAPCIPSSIRKGEAVEVGGVMATVVETLRVRASYFESEPLSREPSTWTRGEVSAEYRIGQVKFPAPFAHYEIDIVDLSESDR